MCGVFLMKRRGLFRCLGYSRIQDYAEAELDLRKSKTKDLIEIARRIETLPATRNAFEKGEHSAARGRNQERRRQRRAAIRWTKARQVIRVATPESEEGWLHKASTLSNRGLESAVAREKSEPLVERIVLELTLAEAADIHECPTCEAASRDADRGPIEFPPEEMQAAKGDAAILDLTEGGKGTFKHTITPSERRAVIARDRERCALCGRKQWLHIHHIVRKAGDPAVLSLLCWWR